MAGKLTTGIWVGFLVSLVLGFDWRQVVKDALNSGRPVEGAFVLAVLLPTLMFLAARSLTGSRAGAFSASCGVETSSG